MFSTRELSSLLAVLTEGSFEAAARSLHVTPGAMSQRIKQLEDRVGQLLVLRTQPTRPTAAGETLLRLAQQVNLLCDEAGRVLTRQHAQASRQLTVAVNHDSLATWFVPAAAQFVSDGTALLDVRCTDLARTDRLLRDGTAIAAVTSSAEEIPGCARHYLGAQEYLAVATPEFARRWFADGIHSQALAAAPFVAFDRDDRREFYDFARQHTRRRIEPTAHHIPSSHDISAAVRAGVGWTLLPAAMVRSHVDSGAMLELPTRTAILRQLHWHAWSVDTDHLRRLTSAVLVAARQGLHRPAGHRVA